MGVSKPLFEKTLARPVEIAGVGLHTGEKTRVRILPAEPGSGIGFTRVARKNDPSSSRMRGSDPRMRGDDVARGDDVKRRSRVWVDGQPIETVEHLVSAFVGLGIANARVEVRGPEIPALDGSAAGFAKRLAGAGLVAQKKKREVFELREPLFVSGERSAILALPYPGFRVTYTLDYAHPLLKGQTVSFEIDAPTYLRQIAPARTFCTREEAVALREAGYGKGAGYGNTLVMGPRGPVRNRLRFRDECARHKVLDLIGDLGLLGFAVRAHFIAVRSGHALNRKMAQCVSQQKGKNS